MTDNFICGYTATSEMCVYSPADCYLAVPQKRHWRSEKTLLAAAEDGWMRKIFLAQLDQCGRVVEPLDRIKFFIQICNTS